MKLHPASPAIDYALYLKGVVNFNDDLGLFSFLTRQDLSERDQKAAKESFEAFKELVDPLPRIALHARRAPAHELHRQLAGRSTKCTWRATTTRAAPTWPPSTARRSRWPTTAKCRRSKKRCTSWCKSYDALGMTQLRDDAKRVMEKNYPKSEYLSQRLHAQDDPWWKVW